jgi:hypothetical protein
MKAQSTINNGRSGPKNFNNVTVINSSNPTLENGMTSSSSKEPLMKRFMRWLLPDQRMAHRHAMPPLTAYLGMVRSSKEFKVGDVSVAGFYMITDERWIEGTGFPVTLERTDEAGKGMTLTVYARVIRTGVDGVGFSFLKEKDEEQATSPDGGTKVDLTKVAVFLNGLPLADSTADRLERAS